jgi:misacylated tRNA(Ala) deacylase
MKHLEDSYVKEFDAVVSDVRDATQVILDHTYFYAVSGGQPTDTGIIVRKSDGKEFKVTNVKKGEGGIVHEVVNDVAVLAAGDEVRCVIDWERRHRLMRSHTAAHVVSEIIHRKTGAMITGNQLELEKVRIDFSLDAFDAEAFAAYIDEANALIAQGLPVTGEIMPRAEAMRIPTISKLANGLPEHITEVRVVTIQGFDQQGCGGTHVKNTAEIGTLEFVKADNRGQKNRRVYFKLV